METIDTINLSRVLKPSQQIRWAVLEMMGPPADISALDMLHNTALWIETGTVGRTITPELPAPAVEAVTDLEPVAEDPAPAPQDEAEPEAAAEPDADAPAEVPTPVAIQSPDEDDIAALGEAVVAAVAEGYITKRAVLAAVPMKSQTWLRVVRHLEAAGRLERRGSTSSMTLWLPGTEAEAEPEPAPDDAPAPVETVEAPAPQPPPWVDATLDQVQLFLVEQDSDSLRLPDGRWLVDEIEMTAEAMLNTVNTIRRSQGVPPFRVSRDELGPPPVATPEPAPESAHDLTPEDLKRQWLDHRDPSTKANLGDHEELVTWLKTTCSIFIAMAPNRKRWMWGGRAVTTQELYQRGNQERKLRGLEPIAMPKGAKP